MKKVEFVKVESELVSFGLGKGGRYKFQGMEEIIEKRILDG